MANGYKIKLYRAIKCPECNKETKYDEYDILKDMRNFKVKLECSFCGHQHIETDEYISKCPYQIITED